MLGLRWEIPSEREFYRNIGRRIRKYRRRANATQAEVARRLDLSQSAVAHWERGTAHVSILDLYQLAAILEIPPEQLLPDPTASWRFERAGAAKRTSA